MISVRLAPGLSSLVVLHRNFQGEALPDTPLMQSLLIYLVIHSQLHSYTFPSNCHPPIHLPIRVNIQPPTHIPVRPSTFCPSSHLLTHPSTCLSTCQPVYLSIHAPAHLSIICPSAHLSPHLPIHHPFVHSCVHPNHTSNPSVQGSFLEHSMLGPVLGGGKATMAGVSMAHVLGNIHTSKLRNN